MHLMQNTGQDRQMPSGCAKYLFGQFLKQISFNGRSLKFSKDLVLRKNRPFVQRHPKGVEVILKGHSMSKPSEQVHILGTLLIWEPASQMRTHRFFSLPLIWWKYGSGQRVKHLPFSSKVSGGQNHEMHSWLWDNLSTPISRMQFTVGYRMLKISYPYWSNTLNSGQNLFNTNTKGDLNITYLEIPHLLSYFNPSKFSSGVIKSFESLKTFVDRMKGENLYLAILFKSFAKKILNSPFEALKPQSPSFLKIDRLLLCRIILLLEAVTNFWGILKLVIHF